ncbi:hypothetical protein RAH32_07770 [Paracoccus sp. WLY502]|uniref:hypothetical protein n=1 Tax=Paracoccus yibinensis TaxID=3068891 RepID=UPI002796B529|nr:hypothetical protein [Paracoccus sp. WLY502]MDQ1900340.1 hypothetical protein [Paracoccus sp. WLY502]
MRLPGALNRLTARLPRSRAAIPMKPSDLLSAREVAREVAQAVLDGRPGSLFRMGDTGGMILSRPEPGSYGFAYLRRFLGKDLTRGQALWFARALLRANLEADIIGLRSDLIGPTIDRSIFDGASEELLPYLLRNYPIREVEKGASPQDALRLAKTRCAIEDTAFKATALFTDAWIHVGLAENGLISALLRHSPSIAVVSSRSDVIRPLAERLGERLRVYSCPAYPEVEGELGGNHSFLWQRWRAIYDHLKPAYPGEPCLIAGGIWTKLVGMQFRRRGGYAIDFGSALDYLVADPSRPLVLADRYGAADRVPGFLTLQDQLDRTEQIEDYL